MPRMISRISTLIAALAAIVTFAVAAPAADAAADPFALTPIAALPVVGSPGACGTSTGAEVQGRTGGAVAQICGGLSFVGPAIGQIDSTIGPTIISPAVTGAVIVTGNNVVVGP